MIYIYDNVTPYILVDRFLCIYDNVTPCILVDRFLRNVLGLSVDQITKNNNPDASNFHLRVARQIMSTVSGFKAIEISSYHGNTTTEVFV
jgi:hypothetical protein